MLEKYINIECFGRVYKNSMFCCCALVPSWISSPLLNYANLDGQGRSQNGYQRNAYSVITEELQKDRRLGG